MKDVIVNHEWKKLLVDQDLTEDLLRRGNLLFRRQKGECAAMLAIDDDRDLGDTALPVSLSGFSGLLDAIDGDREEGPPKVVVNKRNVQALWNRLSNGFWEKAGDSVHLCAAGARVQQTLGPDASVQDVVDRLNVPSRQDSTKAQHEGTARNGAGCRSSCRIHAESYRYCC